MRLAYAIALACLTAAPALAGSSRYSSDCQSSIEGGHFTMNCDSNFRYGHAEDAAPAASTSHLVHPTDAADTSINNFCGRGYRMTSDGCAQN